MSSPSEIGQAPAAGGINIFRVPEAGVAPFEFRMLTNEDTEAIVWTAGAAPESDLCQVPSGETRTGQSVRNRSDVAARETKQRLATEAARQESFQEGEREGRRAMKAELDTQMSLQVACERERVGSAVEQFRTARDHYFEEVEQEVVKLALAIATRVLHREAQLDPLLLRGVVRVALEKMVDRSGVILRVAGADVDAWERSLSALQPHERPRVAEDGRMQRGECVLETTMGRVELGVQVQLEEIEKGFFDLLNHRPTH